MNTREPLQEQLALLERAHTTRFEDDEEWWVWFVTKKLGLPLPYERAVRKAVDETPWRSMGSPIGYVKRAAKFMARDKLGLCDPDDGVFKKVRFEIEAHEVAAASLVLQKRDGKFETSDEALERVLHAYAEARERGEDHDIESLRRHGFSVGWLLDELNLGDRDQLRYYILDRFLGVRGRRHSETTRKRFQRLRASIQKALRRYAQDAAWLDEE